MTVLSSRWLDWQPSNSTVDGVHAGNDGIRRPAPSTSETPIQRTDKTDRSPSVSFVSASPRRSEGEFHANDVANRSEPELTKLYPVAPSDEWLADEFYQLRDRAAEPDPDDYEERAAIMEYDGELSRDEAERLAGSHEK